MRIAITIIFLLTATSTYGQRKSVTDNQATEGSNWEKDDARRFFKEYYKKQKHQPFAGKISTLSKGVYKYNRDIIITYDTTEVSQYLFEKGILHSGLFCGGRDTTEKPVEKPTTTNQDAFYIFTRTDTLYISGITDLSFRHTPAKKKRFSFYLKRIGLSNFIEYYFELTNPTANPTTNLIDFIKGSRLTFFQQHSILI